MYCPRCGQQQISDNTRFCSRCGLPTNELAEWLASGGAPGLRNESTVTSPSPKRKGIKRGAKVLFLSAVLAPLFLGLSLAVDSPEPLFIPFTVFITGLLLMLYSVIFSDDTPAPKTQSKRTIGQMSSGAGAGALPPASNLWTTNVEGRRAKTAEIVQPPSVTENTTRLLADD